MVNLYRTWSKFFENKDPLLDAFLQNKPPAKSFACLDTWAMYTPSRVSLAEY